MYKRLTSLTSPLHPSQPSIGCRTKLLLLQLDAEGAKALKGGSIRDAISVSWLLSPETFTASSSDGGQNHLRLVKCGLRTEVLRGSRGGWRS